MRVSEELYQKMPHHLQKLFVNHSQEEVLELFPEPHGAGSKRTKMVESYYSASSYDMSSTRQMNRFGDSGSAARFFYCAKSSKRERGENNNHPTVKPLALMEYLCKLVKMPERNLILDPFMGSGTTLLACKKLGIKCVGIDDNTGSCETALMRYLESL